MTPYDRAKMIKIGNVNLEPLDTTEKERGITIVTPGTFLSTQDVQDLRNALQTGIQLSLDAEDAEANEQITQAITILNK